MQNAMTEQKDAWFSPEESRRSVRAGGRMRVDDSLPSGPPERAERSPPLRARLWSRWGLTGNRAL